MIERLILVDAVLDDRDVLWLGTESDKARCFLQRLAEYRLEPRELSHLTFGSGPRQTLRLFPDKLPIGIEPIGDRYGFTYLAPQRRTSTCGTATESGQQDYEDHHGKATR